MLPGDVGDETSRKMRNVIHALWSDGSNELAADFIASGFSLCLSARIKVLNG